MAIDSFHTWRYMEAIKSHFNPKSKYDWVQSQGIPQKSFNLPRYSRRKDIKCFQAVSYKLKTKEAVLGSMVAHCVYYPNKWKTHVSVLMGDDSIYPAWLKYNDSLTYYTLQEIKRIHEEVDLNRLLTTPEFLLESQGLLSVECRLETLVVLNDITGFLAELNQKDEKVQLLKQYAPFVRYDRAAVEKYLSTILTS